MIKKIYGIKDELADEMYTPVVFNNENEALRYFANIVNDERLSSNMYHNPHDFWLYSLGTWDTEQGIVSIENKKIVRGDEMKHAKDK